MRLKTLSARNFTGTNFDIAFDPITIVTGENGAGKTAIPTAIRVLFTGSLPPPIGVKGIYRYAGNPDQPGEMSLAAEMDNGRKVSLKWTRNAKGTVSVEGGIPTDLIMPPMLANPKSFWAQTGSERVRAIFESCAGAGQDLDKKIIARSSEIQVMPAKVREAVMFEVTGWVRDILADGSQSGIARLLDTCKTEAKASADKAKTTAGAIRGIPLPAVKPSDLTNDLAALRLELATLSVSAKNERGIHQKGLEEIEARLAAYSRKYKETPTDRLLEFIDSELQTVAKDLRKLTPLAPMDDEEDQFSNACAEQHEWQGRIQLWSVKFESATKQLADLEIMTCCPSCLNKAKGWKDKALAALTEQKNKAQEELARASTKKAAADAEAARLAALIDKARKEKAEHNRYKAELESEAEAFTTDRENISRLIGERARLVQVLANCGETDAALPGKLQALKEKIAKMDEDQNIFASYGINLRRREQLESELINSQARADVLKAAIKVVTEEQAKASEAAFGSVLGVARHFTDGLLNSPLEFVDGDLGRRVSALDRKRAGFVAPLGSWITHETFSDSEQRIAYIGFSVALAATAPIKLVIIDELATLSAGRKILFVDRLIHLVRKGIIDQAICIEPGHADYESFQSEEEVRLIRL